MGMLDPRALENLREMAGGDVAFLAELLNTFTEDAQRMLADMRQALEDGDAVLLRRAAHSFKSNSAEFGATTLSALCLKLEMLARDGALEGAAELVTQVEAEYGRVEPVLQAVVQ